MNYTYQIFEKIFIPKLVILFRLFTIIIMNKISIFEIKKIFNISILLFVILNKYRAVDNTSISRLMTTLNTQGDILLF